MRVFFLQGFHSQNLCAIFATHAKYFFRCVTLLREKTAICAIIRKCHMFFAISLFYTGCPKKHGNSVTNSISSFQIILWFSIVIPTEKAVICISFVCYVHILFVYVLTATDCTYRLYKQSKLVSLHCSSCGDIIDTSLQSFTLFIK